MQRPPLPPTATQPALAAKRLAHWREELLRTVLAVAVPTGTVLVFIGTLVAWFMRDWSMGITNIAGLAALLAIRFWRGMPASMQGAGLLAIVTGVGLSFLVNQIGAFGLPWLCAAPVLAVLLLGRTAAWWTLLFVCAVVFPTAYWQGLPLAPLPLLPHPELMWTLLTLNYLVLGVIIAQSAAVLLRHLDQALEKANTSEHVMAQLALVDSLTGLPNRRALRDELLALSRQDTWEGALLFIDVDNFKDINDTYGHLKGDELLVRVARRLTTQLRQPAYLARVGGDEFVAVLHHDPRQPQPIAEQALAKAEQLRKALSRPVVLPDKQRVSSGISIGLSLLRSTHLKPDDAMREADTALHHAKNKGRNQVVMFEERMHTTLHQRMHVAQELTHALRNQGMSYAVQTQVNAAQEPVGAELLARWVHPTLGMVPPSEFIPLAEQNSLIIPLGNWMLEQACLLALNLRERGYAFPLSVNISAQQFRQPGFEQQLQDILATHGVPPQALMLEITESLTMTDKGETIDSMARLVERGFRFSMDDFGTGYSSLSYLKRLPLHELKIDRSFVDDLPHDANDVAIVRMILSMADNLGLKVVAEGVETQAQADFLVAHNCHSMQGYLFSRPQPVEAWLATLPDSPLRHRAPRADVTHV